MHPAMDSLSKINGQIERITFSNEENGFTIAKLRNNKIQKRFTGLSGRLKR